MTHPRDIMYELYAWAESGWDFMFGLSNAWFEAADVFDETEARARGLLNEEGYHG